MNIINTAVHLLCKLKIKNTMKKIFLTIATAALFTANVFAANSVTKSEDKTTATVSYTAEAKFTADFVGAKNVVWEVTSTFQKAHFILDDTKMTAFYNLRGEYMGVTESVQFKALPTNAKKEIGVKYAGYQAVDVIKLDTGDNGFDSTLYFVDLKKDDKEVLVRVTPAGAVYLFQNVK